MEHVPKHTHHRKLFLNGFNGSKLMVCNVCNGICSGNHTYVCDDFYCFFVFVFSAVIIPYPYSCIMFLVFI